jgi:hypothetical protein
MKLQVVCLSEWNSDLWLIKNYGYNEDSVGSKQNISKKLNT